MYAVHKRCLRYCLDKPHSAKIPLQTLGETPYLYAYKIKNWIYMVSVKAG